MRSHFYLEQCRQLEKECPTYLSGMPLLPYGEAESVGQCQYQTCLCPVHCLERPQVLVQVVALVPRFPQSGCAEGHGRFQAAGLGDLDQFEYR